MVDKAEIDFMGEAIELAARGMGHTRPNPPVGAVVVRGGEIIGRGWHKRCGGEHAEVSAIKDALQKVKVRGEGEQWNNRMSITRNSTLYVTLEPCSKAGRVGACTDAIIAAGIKKVVWAVPDPNPKNRGKAKRVLRAAGIECECWADGEEKVKVRGEGEQWIVESDECKARGEVEKRGGQWNNRLIEYSNNRMKVEEARRRDKEGIVDCARRLIAPFAKHVTTGLPYVTVKIAMSLDGKICDNWGDAKWVSSARARRATGQFRSEVDVMMVGAETIRKDDPSLLCHQKRNDDLWRAVVSKSGRLPKNAQVFTDEAKGRTLVYRDAAEAVRDLGKRGFMHILCEGGLKLATALAEAGLVDEWITVLAPKAIGTRRIGKAVTFEGEDVIVSYTRDKNVASPLIEGLH